MGRRAIEEKIVLLHILAVISFLIGQAKHSFFEDRVLFIPQCHREAYMLPVIAKASHAIFVPAICAAARVIVRKIVPGIPISAVVFSHGSPGALAKIRTPAMPIGLPCVIFYQAIFFRVGDHAQSGPSYSRPSRRR